MPRAHGNYFLKHKLCCVMSSLKFKTVDSNKLFSVIRRWHDDYIHKKTIYIHFNNKSRLKLLWLFATVYNGYKFCGFTKTEYKEVIDLFIHTF